MFAEPWESRAFGMAVTLYEAGVFTWPQFQAALIARIAAWESTATEGAQWSYYRALAGCTRGRAWRGCGAVRRRGRHRPRARTLAQRPAGHDHSH